MALQNVKIRRKSAGLGFKLPGIGGISQKDIVIFTRQFATMIDAGLPLVQCLDILGNQQPNKTFQTIIRDVKTDVEQGSTFADALRKHPKPFNELYVNLVQAGEIGGILDTILNRLSVYLEKADALAKKVKGAMVYPTTVLVIAIGVVILMLTKVIPTFEKMFSDFGGELPAPTQFVVALSHFMQQWIVPFLAAVVGLFMAFFAARRRSPKFRKSTDALALKLPVFGSLLRKVAVARGEETGAMETMLAKIADFYDEEVDAAVDALTALLEPVMMVFLGGTVGGLLIAMYLPIFKIADTIG